jgi:hypothetical protein
MMMAAAYVIGNTTTRTGPDELRTASCGTETLTAQSTRSSVACGGGTGDTTMLLITKHFSGLLPRGSRSMNGGSMSLQSLNRGDRGVDARQCFDSRGLTRHGNWPHSSAYWPRRGLRQAPAFGNLPHDEVHGVAASSVRQPSSFPRIA